MPSFVVEEKWQLTGQGAVTIKKAMPSVHTIIVRYLLRGELNSISLELFIYKNHKELVRTTNILGEKARFRIIGGQHY